MSGAMAQDYALAVGSMVAIHSGYTHKQVGTGTVVRVLTRWVLVEAPQWAVPVKFRTCAASGYCTRRAPTPTAEDDQKVYWRVTHATDSCGDGAQMELDTVDTSDDEMPALEAAPV